MLNKETGEGGGSKAMPVLVLVCQRGQTETLRAILGTLVHEFEGQNQVTLSDALSLGARASDGRSGVLDERGREEERDARMVPGDSPTLVCCSGTA